MDGYRFTLFEDRFQPGAAVEYLTPGANRALLMLEGSIGLGDGQSLSRHEAAVAPGRARLETGHEHALLLRWELTPEEEADEVDGVGVSAREMLSGTLYLSREEGACMRLERISIPAEGNAPFESHPAPSIRLLTEGEMLIVEDGKRRSLKPGDAWFDMGGNPSVGRVTEGTDTITFLRLILLPESYRGRDSIRPLEDVDTTGLDYEILLDEIVDL